MRSNAAWVWGFLGKERKKEGEKEEERTRKEGRRKDKKKNEEKRGKDSCPREGSMTGLKRERERELQNNEIKALWCIYIGFPILNGSKLGQLLKFH